MDSAQPSQRQDPEWDKLLLSRDQRLNQEWDTWEAQTSFTRQSEQEKQSGESAATNWKKCTDIAYEGIDTAWSIKADEPNEERLGA